MRRLLSLVLAVMALGALATPAAAASDRSGPANYCRSVHMPMTNPVSGLTFSQYVIKVEFNFGGESVVEDFGLSSFQACVSTVAASMNADGVVPASAISKPSYLAQCDFLANAGVVSYPYSFYGTYPADNRADCAKILQGVHSGTLPLPGPPPVGG
jgi:hypothetical protein